MGVAHSRIIGKTKTSLKAYRANEEVLMLNTGKKWNKELRIALKLINCFKTGTYRYLPFII